MHPQLTDKTRGTLDCICFIPVDLLRYDILVCKDLIDQLELCHSDIWAKYTGGCNDTKLKLNLCLRSEVLA